MTVSPAKYKPVFRSMLCALVCLGLGACGIKPGSLTPPSGDNAPYPATYPKDTQPVINPYKDAVAK